MATLIASTHVATLIASTHEATLIASTHEATLIASTHEATLIAATHIVKVLDQYCFTCYAICHWYSLETPPIQYCNRPNTVITWVVAVVCSVQLELGTLK